MPATPVRPSPAPVADNPRPPGLRLMRRPAVLAGFTIVLGLVISWALYRSVLDSGMQLAAGLFRQECEARFDTTRRDFRQTLDLTYDAIRTMASLPSVQKIDRYATNFEGDGRLTVQQLYNDVASHVAVSEIYIVPADLEPDQLDPKTGKPQEPITTFDQIIVGKSLDHAKHDEAREHEELEEVEIHEYRQMKQQCAYFVEHYPDSSYVKGLERPAISSHEVITCDNSEFSKALLDAHDDAPRNGIVYSVPFYGADGKFKGMVSAVLRTQVLAKLLGPHFVLSRPTSQYAVASPAFSSELAPALSNMRSGLAPAGYPYARSAACEVRDEGEWVLACAVPSSVFAASPDVQAARARANLVLLAGVLTSALLAGLVWATASTNRRAVAMATRMTADLSASETRFRTLVQNVPGAIYRCAANTGRAIHYISQAIQSMTGVEPEAFLAAPAPSRSFNDVIHPDDRRKVADAIDAALRRGEPYVIEYRILRPEGDAERWVQDRGRAVAGPDGWPAYLDGAIIDITATKLAQRERDEMNRKLQGASRRAGMAEVATGVLHNVGNVLNTVNISASVATRRVRESEAPSLVKLGQLLGEHRDDLAAFLTADERGRLVPEFICELADVIGQEQQAVLGELETLGQGIEHIRQVVTSQQSLARNATMLTPAAPSELVEAALTMQCDSIVRHNIEIVRRFEPVGPVMLDKHKVLQILINLVANAKHAVNSTGQLQKRLCLAIDVVDTDTGPRLRFAIEDNGVGIAPENLTRVFAHGFTTRDDGHGFGLHSAANAAREMGGDLTVHSDGPGTGARFTLSLPARLASHSDINSEASCRA